MQSKHHSQKLVPTKIYTNKVVVYKSTRSHILNFESAFYAESDYLKKENLNHCFPVFPV